MEAISLKLEENLLKEIDSKLSKHRYSTRTEFIRDAIRQRLSQLEKEALLRHVDLINGSSKRKTTDRDLHIAREKVFNEIEKKYHLR